MLIDVIMFIMHFSILPIYPDMIPCNDKVSFYDSFNEDEVCFIFIYGLSLGDLFSPERIKVKVNKALVAGICPAF